MKCLMLLPLLALTLLLGACSSYMTTNVQHSPPPAPVRVADRTTVWGELPSYEAKGQYFVQVRYPSLRALSHDGATTLDLLVNRDGTVQKTAVVASSGDRAKDLAVAEMYGSARYSLPLGADDPAPYVVSQTVDFKVSPANDYSSTDYDPTSSPQYSNPGNSNTVNGFVR